MFGSDQNNWFKAKEAFSIYNVNANRYYPEILSKRKFLKKLLNSIPPNQQLEAQGKKLKINCEKML